MKKSISFKMTALFALFALVLVLALSVFIYLTAWESYTNIYMNNARGTAKEAASMLDGNQIADYLKTGAKDANYLRQQEILNHIKRENDIRYLFVLAPGEDSFTYIMEAQLDTDDPSVISKLGDVYEYNYIQYDYLLADVKAKRPSSQKVISDNVDGYGRVVSAWAPVLSDDGELAAMVEVDIALSKVEKNLFSFLVKVMLLSVGVIILMVFILRQIMRRMISKPLKELKNNALNFTRNEELAPFTNVIRTGDEMQELSEAFVKMAGDIEDYTKSLAEVTADRERIAAELNVAAKIQASMLPGIFPAFSNRAGFDVYATMRPAKEVGGDFYDFFMLDKQTLAVVIADVSGKGVPASLFMVIAKTLLKNNAQMGKDPAEVFATVNNLLCENNEAGMFVTAFMGYLDIAGGKFTFVNAGHNPPLLYANGRFDWLKGKRGFVLAGMEDTIYRQNEVVLKPGDELFLYTDGVTEAMNPKNKLFTEARLLGALTANAGIGLKELLDSVEMSVDAFADGAEQADDITMLSLRYKGDKQEMDELVVPADIIEIQTAQDFIGARLVDAAAKVRNKINIVVDEIFNNIASYAYSEGGGKITVRVAVDEDIHLEFEDCGAAYNPLTAAEPDVTLPAGERKTGGLGLFMVKKLMDSMEYRREGAKNILTLRKKLE